MASASPDDASASAPQFQDDDPKAALVQYLDVRLHQATARQLGYAICGLVILTFEGPVLGIFTYLMLLTVEFIDNRTMRRVRSRLGRTLSLEDGFRRTMISAIVQSLAFSICVFVMFFGSVTGQAPLFALAFMVSMAASSGLLMPYHPRVTRIRLGIYIVTLATVLTGSLIRADEWDPVLILNTLGAVLLAFYVRMFLDSVYSGRRQRRRQDQVLKEQANALAAANDAMRRRQREMHRLNLVARNANDSVILSRPGGVITWVNDAFTRNTGYTREEAEGRRIGDLLDGPDTSDETVAAIADAVRNGRPFRGEILNYTKAGGKIWTDINIVPVAGEDGQPEMVVSVERDVTAARLHATELAAAKLAAEEGAKAKADFLATMSHEIRTPMNGVMGMADLLAETDLDEDQRLFADTIRSSAQALLTVINDILDLSKLDAGKMRLSPVNFDLPETLTALIRLLGPQARDKGLRLELDTGDTLVQTVFADDGRLRQVLLNLVGNAVKFTESGSVTLRARSFDTGAGHDVIFEVCDTGIGIPSDKLDRVFEGFSQAEASTTRRFGGTGLGLTIARMIVEAMGGWIEVTSEEGVGTTFTVNLTLAYPEDCARVSGERSAERSTTSMSQYAGLSVLVAEDNRVNRLLIEKFLEGSPLHLQFAHDGQEVVVLTRKLAPDVVFMDMSMPIMSGIEATRQIREMDDIPQPVIIALTANAFAGDRAECLQAGMNAFLSKPVRKAQLLEAIRTHCRPPEHRAAE
ncbi:hybrid sensor histidine kinase/response regulator [Chachezhania antarctica]|uniref:hybrid sensor histidine kinase/response regulator n=1 Tax=Chachezhania antarctica TaxID=2340860 RepID=UPI000EABEEE3|nr:PAS domain-containing hybrid sensor histidine kinase/response regulator [Chachezhania antarctica]|tara:strand:- start:6389 stop:8641 length:2253 start_codon:yes stop_codon:yes gene_type:complete